MESRRRRIIFRLVAMLALATACLAALLLWLNRSPLTGQRSHDFGVVRFDQPPKFVDHVFTLTNRTSETLEILAVRASCGCTIARTEAKSVGPGESFDVAVTLEFSQSGHRRKPLYVVLKDRGMVTLWIEGTGRQTRQLAALRDDVALTSDAPAYLSIFHARFDGEPSPPPTPIIHGPPGVTATLINWKLGVRGDASEGKPDQWGGQIKLDWDGTPLAQDAQLRVKVGAEHEIAVRLHVAEQANHSPKPVHPG
jgi:hypothetical protein